MMWWYGLQTSQELQMSLSELIEVSWVSNKATYKADPLFWEGGLKTLQEVDGECSSCTCQSSSLSLLLLRQAGIIDD